MALRMLGFGLSISAVLFLGGAEWAQAQTSQADRELIQQLTRGSGAQRANPDRGRGIRLSPSGGEGPDVAAPRGPATQTAPMAAMPQPASPAAQPRTTAPIDTPAASLTVNFVSGSAALTPAAEAQLARLGRALTSPNLANDRFRIEGHTDTVGASDVNQTLSENRAATVVDYLVQRFGVDRARLEAIGRGESDPLVRTGDEVAEPRNRRVQILNITQ
jgi:OOP family OmpA-OmpF porin